MLLTSMNEEHRCMDDMNTVRIPLSLVEDTDMKLIDLHGEIDVPSSHEHSNLLVVAFVATEGVWGRVLCH